jgi:DNA-binding MarR family transcriptional regulator
MTKFFNANRNLGKLHILRRICNEKKTRRLPFYKSQYEFIEYVTNNPGCTQASLAEKFLITPASVALSIKRMEKSGLIKREINNENKRSNKLFCTKKAIDAANECRSIMDEIDTLMFDGFSDKELLEFEEYTDRILNNMSKHYFGGKILDRHQVFAMIREMEAE